MALAPGKFGFFLTASLWIFLLCQSQVMATDSGLNLTVHEAVMSIPAPALLRERSRAVNGRFLQQMVSDGIPEGVNCTESTWCDSRNVCARICARGSVRIDPWLQQAIDYQWRLSRAQPLCFAQLLGTHNSAITLANGYGMHDPIYTEYLRYLGLASGNQALVTNNQVLSITDQLNLGVRFVEVDVHWIQNGLHVAHCGGLHSPGLNQLVRLLSAVAALFGHPPVEWDAETVGCDPSLSSLPAKDQRSFADAVSEVADWLLAPGNAHEFVVLYMDNQADLGTWGKVSELLGQVTAVIPEELIVTPAEYRDITQAQGAPPSIEQLVRQSGKRVLLMSGTDYGSDMSYLAFDHRQPCNFSEPLFRGFAGAPNCSFRGWHAHSSMPAMAGRLLRTPTCHLSYGPYNCSLQRGENIPQLDLQSLPEATSCGINVPAPDLLTPALVATHVWSWAAGHPPVQATAAAAAEVEEKEREVEEGPQRREEGRHEEEGRQEVGAMGAAGEKDSQCAMVRSSDGRWEVRPCSDASFMACRLDAGPQHLQDDRAWALVEALAACPAGYVFGAPHTARENSALQQQLLLLSSNSRSEAVASQGTAAAAVISLSGIGTAREGGGSREVSMSRRLLMTGSRVEVGEEGEGDQGGEVYAVLALHPPSWLPQGLEGAVAY